jgi:hypothetical protein
MSSIVRWCGVAWFALACSCANGGTEDLPVGGDAGTETTAQDSSEEDTALQEDTGADSAPDTMMEEDTAVDTGADTAPVMCTGEESEPNDTDTMARALTNIDDCDGSGKSWSGVLHDEKDVDVYTFEGSDTFGCSVNAYAKATGDVWMCLKPVCKTGSTTYKGCTKGTRTGDDCCGNEVEADFNCSGTTDESAVVTIRVSSTDTLLTCGAYTFQYHY